MLFNWFTATQESTNVAHTSHIETLGVMLNTCETERHRLTVRLEDIQGKRL